MLEEHNGKYYKDLEVKLQNRLQDITLRTFELDKTTSKDMLFVIFERLNTGGVPLNDMEIRNCIFRGAINQLICELVEDENFKQVVNQQGLSTRMVDRELVLRFLAFYQFHYSKATTGIKAFLNEFSQTYQHANAQKTSEFRDKFKKAMRASFTIFGSSGFRVIQSDTYKIAPRVNKTIFQAVATSFAEYDIGALTRSADSIYEAYFDLVQSDRYFYDCTRTATGDQRRLKYVFETWRTRLDNIMSTVEANDSVRLFSRELKKQMFAESQVCAICNQQISHINDAALDHDRHYWLGGKTVPENARLVHRQCNWERPNS
jgi:uncharacterized protein with ParB-like and HNH nuclease domain